MKAVLAAVTLTGLACAALAAPSGRMRDAALMPQATAGAAASERKRAGDVADELRKKPRFEDYATTERFEGAAASVQLLSAPYGRTYRTRLREGARNGPNFAGRFTVVIWGCGAPCQLVAVIDAASGRLSRQLLHTSNGVDYRPDSRLLLADPVRANDPPQCVSCGTPAAYVWTGEEFQPVAPSAHDHRVNWRP